MTTDATAGVDLFYNPTPLLRTTFTVNTDFAQTEVDQRQVNLTRYSLFFPEQRDFFLDGATFFDFASDSGGGENFFSPVGRTSEERIIPFFSRRIGLSADATPQKIDFGGKVTGQAGANDVGLLHVRSGEDDGFSGDDFTVARAKRRVLRQSYVGAMYARRNPRLAGARPDHTAGVDARLATSTFLGDQNLEGSGWFLYNGGAGASRGGNRAFGTSLLYPNDLWNARIDASEVGANFDPAIGFVSRHAGRDGAAGRRRSRKVPSRAERPGRCGCARHVHVRGSAHYAGLAVDFLSSNNDGLSTMFKLAGYRVLWRVPGHYGHVHVEQQRLSESSQPPPLRPRMGPRIGG